MKKILVVDDSKSICNLLRRELLKLGYSVVFALDGMQGVMYARKSKPDLIVLDFNLPAGNGLKVAERVRDSTLTRNIPIVIFSGANIEEARERLMELGITCFVKKPDIEGLLNKVEELA